MEKDKLIEALVRALGTMVEAPEYESDPNNIGKKVMVGIVRKPILEGEDRDKVTAALVSIVEGCAPERVAKVSLASGTVVAPGSVLLA